MSDIDRRVPLAAEGLSADAFVPTEWAMVAFISLVWGSSYFWIANGLESLSPYTIAWVRLGLGSTTLRCFPAARASRPHGSDWPRLALLSVTWMALPLTLFPLAEQRIASSVTGMLNGALPILVALVAAVLLRRPPGRSQRIGLAIGFAGIVCISLPSLGDGSSSAAGVGLVALALACYALSGNLSVPLTQRYGALPVQMNAQTLAFALTSPLGLWGLRSSSFEWKPVLSMLVLGIVGTGLAFVACGMLFARVGSTRGSVFNYLIPVVAIVLGVTFRDESVAPLALVGAGVVMTGAYVTTRAGR